jgi:hypothetical protein
VPKQPTNHPPLHGPGFFDDPFMIPESAPQGEGHTRRWPTFVALAIMTIVVVLMIVALTH